MGIQEFGGAASSEGVHMSKKSTESCQTEEFKAEADQLLIREAYSPALLEMMSRLVSN